MIENKLSTRLGSVDDAPDLSTPEWQERFARAKVRRGRPRSGNTKISTTIRFDPDVLAFFRNGGEGWQTRINDALRAAMRGKIKSVVKEGALAARPNRPVRNKKA
jgi:uncharacterized protein (DUF4415 family)